MTAIVIIFLLVINCFIAGTVIGVLYGAMTEKRHR